MCRKNVDVNSGNEKEEGTFNPTLKQCVVYTKDNKTPTKQPLDNLIDIWKETARIQIKR